MAVRTKFVCNKVEPLDQGLDIGFRAVRSVDGKGEDAEFETANPYGVLMIHFDTVEAGAEFVVGESYYLDFSPAPTPA